MSMTAEVIDTDATDVEANDNLRLEDLIGRPNVADMLSEGALRQIADRALQESEIDDNSRSEWLKKAEKAIDLAMMVVKKKSYPWRNASNVVYPLIAVAALEFNARAYPAIVGGRGIAKGAVQGSDEGLPQLLPNGQPVLDQQGQPQWIKPPGAKADRAGRISRYLNYQLLEEMPEWEDNTDSMLAALPVVGCMFRKVWRDPILGRNTSELCWPQNVIVNYHATNIETVPRIGHRIYVYPYQIEERMRSGLWSDVDLNLGENSDSEEQECFIEQHRRWDLDGDGYAEPWIVTIHEESGEVVRMKANFEEQDIARGSDGEIVAIKPQQYFIRYNLVPAFDGGFYGIGFGHLLENHSHAISSILNQMIDAGTLANLPSGFLGGGLRMRSGETRFRPGEFKRVTVLGGSIRENVVPLDFKGPNTVLFSLLGLLIESGKEIASIKDVLTGDAPSNAPATTTLALIEQGMKVFSAIYKRTYRSLKGELKLYAALNARYLPDDVYFNYLDKPGQVAREDFASADADVVPVADPQMVTDMQKLGKAQALLDWASQSPVANRLEADKRYLEALDIEEPEKMLQPPPPDPKMIQAESKAKESQIRAQGAFMEQSAKAEKALADAMVAVERLELDENAQDLEAVKLQLEEARIELQAQKQEIDALVEIAKLDNEAQRQAAE